MISTPGVLEGPGFWSVVEVFIGTTFRDKILLEYFISNNPYFKMASHLIRMNRSADNKSTQRLQF